MAQNLFPGIFEQSAIAAVTPKLFKLVANDLSFINVVYL